MRTLLIAPVLLALVGAAPAHAQGSEEVARRLIGEGVEAARTRDWLTARDRFKRAYDIQPIPLTLYNLGAAQEKTGQLVEADRSYRIFLKETGPGELDRFRQAAIDARASLRTRVAYVVLKCPNLGPGDVVRLDQRELPQAVLGEALPSNPGLFTVTVLRGGDVIHTRQLSLAEGESRTETIDIPSATGPVASPAAAPSPAPVAAVAATAAPPPPAEDGGVLGSPVFWAVVAGVVVAGAGVGVFFAVRPGSPFESTLDSISIQGR